MALAPDADNTRLGEQGTPSRALLHASSLLTRFNALQAIELELVGVIPVLLLCVLAGVVGVDHAATDALGAVAGVGVSGAAAYATLETLATGTPPYAFGSLSERTARRVELHALEAEIHASPELENSTVVLVPQLPRDGGKESTDTDI